MKVVQEICALPNRQFGNSKGADQMQAGKRFYAMRNSRVTPDLYAQAGMQEKPEAQSKLVRLVVSKGEALA